MNGYEVSGRSWKGAGRRILAALCLLAAFGITACATGRSAADTGVREKPAVDRHDEVFDTRDDGGRLVARFLKITSGTEAGSGDSAVLTSPDGKIMLIDGGSPECAAQVEQYLRAMGVKKIDAVVATHPHIDHIGGLTHILYSFPVETLYMTKLVYDTGTYGAFIAATEKRGVGVVHLEEGMEFAFGSEVTATVFNPERNIEYYEGYPDNSTQFINNRSLVLKLRFRDSTMLFMSDVYTARETELMEKFPDALQADVMKVGHHGKETSSTRSFVRLVSPKIAVISHEALASVPVYTTYRKTGAAAYVTCIDGTIRVTADGTRNYRVLTQFDRQNDFLK